MAKMKNEALVLHGAKDLRLVRTDNQSSLICTAAEILPEVTTTHAALLLTLSLRKLVRSPYLVRTKCKYQSELPDFAVPTYITTTMAATATSSFSLP
jgi:hypothetical protein